MEISVVRYESNGNETQSIISVDGEKIAFGIEDEFREVKVYGETRIPQGTYNITVRKWGGHHDRYKTRFPWHKGMLEIIDVPGFKDILIHIGNSDKDTAGCLLVGLDVVKNEKEKFILAYSERGYRRLYEKVIEEAIKGNVTIKIVDADR